MIFEQRSPELASALLSARTSEELAPHLGKLYRMISPILAPGAAGNTLYTRDLDDAVPHINRIIGLPDKAATQSRSNQNVCIVATQFADVGGHTRVAADIARLVGGDHVTVILTDIYRNTPYRVALQGEGPAKGFESRAFLVLKAPTLIERTIELYSVLCAINPTRIVLLHNHMDICAVAGTYPYRAITDFFHHCDHEPCLGATIAYSQHVDPTYCVHLCCQSAGLSPIYSSMTVADLQPELAARRPTSGRLLFATCGHLAKYRLPGRYPWSDWVVACLAGRDAEFVHIGPVDDAFRDETYLALDAAGIARDRYVFAGVRPSLRAELATRGVDIYVSSAPENGGKAIHEALGSRIPVIVPADPDRPPLYRFALPLSGWVEVREPSGIAAAVDCCPELRAKMATPEYTQELEGELGRFKAYVAEEPLAEAPPAAVLAV
jgi:hypothetical protein